MMAVLSHRLSLLALCTALVSGGSASLQLTTLASGLAQPVAAIQPDGDARLFIVEQRSGTIGRIRVLKAGSLLATPFLSVSPVATGGEQGLLGVAFHPNFPTTPYFYVNYTDSGGNTNIARYSVPTATSDVATAGSRTNVITIAQPYSNHNGGTLRFGPDGYLYIGMGDGGSGNDPENRAQNKQSLLGKMLRLDVDRDDFPGDSTKNYGIPAGNPYNGTNGLSEIWSYGLRNPWKWAFDRPELNGFGGIFIADVGQGAYEEIDYQAPGVAGSNYGWRVREGLHDTGLGGGTAPFVDPIYEYTHASSCSISGGVLYRGVRLGPDWYGTYFFTDYCNSTIYALRIAFDPTTLQATVTQVLTAIPNFGANLAAIESDTSGELLVSNLSAKTVSRITETTPSAGIFGTVKLNGVIDGGQTPNRLEIQTKRTGEATRTWNVGLSPSGKFQIPAPSGDYQLAVKTPTGLRKVVSVSTTGGDVTGLNLILTNGDIDGDNVVSVFDYGRLSDSFDRAAGDVGFDAAADLDGDGAVTVFDYGLLSDAFGAFGDNPL